MPRIRFIEWGLQWVVITGGIKNTEPAKKIQAAADCWVDLKVESKKDWHFTIFSTVWKSDSFLSRSSTQLWCGPGTVGQTSLVTAAAMIAAGQDDNSHFHLLYLFHESVRINSAALCKIKIAQGDGVPTYLYIVWILSELHSQTEILFWVLRALKRRFY